MALDVGELVATLRVNASTAASDLSKADAQLSSRATQSGKKAGGAFSGAMGGAIKSGLAIGAGFIAFEGVEKFLKSSIGAAQELSESVARTKAVYGSATASVEAWAGTTDKSLGLSKQAALEYAAQLGNVYTQLGFTADKSADLSEQTTSLAVQIAAFKKVDPTQVIDAISAAYRGQTRSLAKLVPGITTAAVTQEALNETGKTNAKTLTAQEKATATLTLVQKDSGAAQKFYADTTGEATHQQAILNAELDNMKASLGQAAIPLLTNMVHILNVDVIPAVSTAGSDLKELSKDIESLPAPVKAAGASLLALVLLGPEIRDLAESVGNNLGDSLDTVRIQSLYMKDAFAKAGGGAKGLASAVGEGASLGLRGALGGVLDIVGGPWGAAFIGASAAVGVLISKHEQAKAEIQSFTSAVEADSGALGANTRAAVVNALAKTQAFKDAKALGISLDDLTDSLLGQAAAQDRVNGTLDQYPAQLGKLSQSGTQAYRSATDLRGILGDTGDKLNQGVAAAKDYSSALGTTADATGTAASSTDSLTASTNSTTTATKKATAAVVTWIQKLDTADGNTQGLKGSQIAYKQSLADAEKALKSNGKTLDLNTQKGRDNASALLGIATAATAHDDALKADGKSNAAVTKVIEAQRAKLYDTARQFGLSKAQAKLYADQLLKIPKTVGPKVKLSGVSTAISDITKVANALTGISGIAAIQFVSQEKKAGRGHAAGGEISGVGGPTQDNQLARVSVGEYVVNASAYKRNKSLVRAINAGSFARGGEIGRYASGGEVDFTTADIGNIFGLAGASHASHSDVTAAIHSRTVATNSLLAAEASLRKEQAKKHPSEAAIHADERRILADRQALTAATTKLKSTEASYKAGQASEITKVTNAATSDVKTVGTFIKNLQLLTARGFGALAQVIYSEYAGGDQSGAEAAASGAVKETSKQLSSLTNSFAASAKQQAALAQFGSTGSFTAPASTGFRITSGAGGLTGSQFANLIHVETMQLLSGAPGDIANTLAFKLQALG